MVTTSTCRRTSLALAIVAGLALMPLAAAGGGARPQASPSQSATTAPPVQPEVFLAQYCVTCHNTRNAAAVRGFVLEGVDVAAPGTRADVWEKVIEKLRAGQMPPAGRRRPDRAVSDSFATRLEDDIDRAAAAHPNPGRTETLHRLNRTEYKNAVRDFLGLEIDVENLLPPDPLGGGDANFDNIATSLRMNQSLLEQYLTVARKVSRTAMSGNVPSTIQTFRPPQNLRQDIRLEGMPFGTRGGIAIDHIFPVDGIYEFAVSHGNPPGVRGAVDGELLELSIDGEQVQMWELKAPESPRRGRRRPEPKTVQVPVRAGARRVIVTFVKTAPRVELAGDRRPLANPGRSTPGNPRQPSVSQMVLTGPLQVGGKSDTSSRRRILTCIPRTVAEEEPCAREILTARARLGLRRPVAEDDLAFLMRFYQEGSWRDRFRRRHRACHSRAARHPGVPQPRPPRTR